MTCIKCGHSGRGVYYSAMLGHWQCDNGALCARRIARRLEALRAEIRAERIGYGEIAELQGLAAYIDPGDVELLQWAGVPEFEGEES